MFHGMSSSPLYGDNNGNGLSSRNEGSNVVSPHMSASSLLQKGDQIDSTTLDLGDTSSFLRSLRSSVPSSIDQNHHHNLQGLMNSLANTGNNANHCSIYGGFSEDGVSLEPRHENRGVCDMDGTANKMHQGLGNHVSFGGSDKLTLDFLGVGEIVRNMQGGGGIGAMSNLDPQLKSTQQSQLFGGTGTLQ